MKFEGYGGQFLVVEFSETGNAAYIYNFADFESRGLTLRTPRFEVKNHLKFNDRPPHFPQVRDWEPQRGTEACLGIRYQTVIFGNSQLRRLG